MVATGLATESHPLGSTDVLRRFAPPTHRTAFWIALWTVTVAAVVVTVVLPAIAGAQDVKERAAAGAIAGAFAGCGLIAWRRRPDSRSGLWMVATGFGLFVGPLLAGFESPTVQEFNDVLDDFWAIAIIAILLTFMSSGRLERTADRVLVGAMGIVVDPADRARTVPRARRQLPARPPGSHRCRRARNCVRPSGRLRLPGHGGGDRCPLQARVGRRSGGRCCRAWPASPHCFSPHWRSPHRPGIW